MKLPRVRPGVLLTSAVVVGALTLLAKLAGAGKELVVAYRFGTAPELGAFLFAYMFPAFMINVLSASLQMALVPRYLAVKASAGIESAGLLAGRVSGLTALALGVAVLVLTPVFAALVPSLATGFDGATVEACRGFLVWLMPTAVLSGLCAIWVGVLNAEGAFRFTSLVPLATPLCVTLALLGPFNLPGATALVAGTLVGVGVETLLLAGRIRASRLPLSVVSRDPGGEVRRVLGQFAPAAAANVLMAGSMVIEQSFAASVSAADVAAYAFGTRLTVVVASVMVTTLSTILLPHFSSIVADSGPASLRGRILPVVASVMAVALPAAAVFALASGPITSLVFERGNFDSGDAALVARIQAVHALYIPIYALSMVAVRLVNALSATRVLLAGSALNLLASAVLNAALVPDVGVVGIAWANVGMYAVSAAFLWIVVLRRLRAAQAGQQ